MTTALAFPRATIAVSGTAALSMVSIKNHDVLEVQTAALGRLLTMVALLPVPRPQLTRYLEPFFCMSRPVEQGNIDGGSFDSSQTKTLDGGAFGEINPNTMDAGGF